MAVTARPSGQRGFSLLELLLVLVILGIAYGLASPLIGNLGGGDIKGTARTVASALKRTRMVAITERKEAPLTFDVENRTITLPGDPRPLSFSSKLDVKLDTVEQELAGEKIASIRFYPDGSSTGGRVTLAQGDRRLQIDVDWLTGRVRITEPGA